MNIIYYCILNYDDNLILVMFILKFHVLLFFSQILNQYFLGIFISQFFEAVRELHKLIF